MTLSRQQAVINALRSTTNQVGMCARWTREQFEVAALGDFDGDGDADAVDMWKACVLKVHDDTAPPVGVPVFWSGGSKGHGHAAVSLGGGMVRSTDAWTAGNVGTVRLVDVGPRWGMHYLGWAIDLYGHEIPDESVPPAPTPSDLLRADLNAAMAPVKAALEKVSKRPRLRFQLERARDAISKARKINRG